MTRWGIVSTVKAPAREILDFVAHHLDLGADHIWIYLDARNEKAQLALEAHPQVTVTRTDSSYWKANKKQKPPMHQVRQTFNAKHAYAQADNVDWLLHIDVDEFIWPQSNVSEILDALPQECLSARVYPSEAMSSDGVDDADPEVTWFKAWISGKQGRRAISRQLYPNYGDYVKGGFVSHVAGKLFARTRVQGIQIRIHKVTLDGVEVSEECTLQSMELLHLHITDWETWQKKFDYRHEKGSYRAELRTALPKHGVGLTIHQVFENISKIPGGMEHFYGEVCRATPQLRQRLDQHGLLRAYRLELDRKRKAYFPDFQAGPRTEIPKNP